MRHTVPTRAAYFEVKSEGVHLSRKHAFYFQVQGQAALLKRGYGDFVCWTPVAIHIERIDYDNEFVSTMIPKLGCFFLKAILPKILCGTTSHDHPVIKTYFCNEYFGCREL